MKLNSRIRTFKKLILLFTNGVCSLKAARMKQSQTFLLTSKVAARCFHSLATKCKIKLCLFVCLSSPLKILPICIAQFLVLHKISALGVHSFINDINCFSNLSWINRVFHTLQFQLQLVSLTAQQGNLYLWSVFQTIPSLEQFNANFLENGVASRSNYLLFPQIYLLINWSTILYLVLFLRFLLHFPGFSGSSNFLGIRLSKTMDSKILCALSSVLWM